MKRVIPFCSRANSGKGGLKEPVGSREVGNKLFRVPQPDGDGMQNNIHIISRSAKGWEDFGSRLTFLLNSLNLH